MAFPIHIDIYIGSIPHCAKEFQIYTLLIWPYTEISFKIQKTGEPYKSSPVGTDVHNDTFANPHEIKVFGSRRIYFTEKI